MSFAYTAYTRNTYMHTHSLSHTGALIVMHMDFVEITIYTQALPECVHNANTSQNDYHSRLSPPQSP